MKHIVNNLNITETTIDERKFDSKNANRHTERGNRLLEKSLSKLGFGRSVLLDRDNNIITGNGVAEKAGELGFSKVRVIETDGTEIIAVKRKDVSINSKKGREMRGVKKQGIMTTTSLKGCFLDHAVKHEFLNI